MINKEFIKDRINKYEGFKESIYLCPAKKKTIGNGINLEACSKEILNMIYEDYKGEQSHSNDRNLQIKEMEDNGYKIQKELNDKIIYIYIEKILKDKETDNIINIKNLEQYETEVVYAVVDLIYNMGIGTFKKFKKTINFIKTKKYILAGLELLDGKYYKQVKSRAVDNAVKLIGAQIKNTEDEDKIRKQLEKIEWRNPEDENIILRRL